MVKKAVNALVSKATSITAGFLFTLSLVALSACGGPCEYKWKKSGIAVITAIVPVASTCQNDRDELFFDFEPSGLGEFIEPKPGDYSFEISAPSRSWAEKSGLVVGSRHPASRFEKTSGSCSGGFIVLNDVDFNAVENVCTQK
jgi:hypothetical protein